MAPRLGPSTDRRIRQRQRVAGGKGLTKKFPNGTVVSFDTDPVMLNVADALYAIARRMGEEGSKAAPDAPVRGVGLVDNWGVMGWAFGKLIQAETAGGASALKKPRTFRTNQASAEAIVGFGFPARFQEIGTVHQPARPFFGPACLRVATSGELVSILRSYIPSGDV